MSTNLELVQSVCGGGCSAIVPHATQSLAVYIGLYLSLRYPVVPVMYCNMGLGICECSLGLWPIIRGHVGQVIWAALFAGAAFHWLLLWLFSGPPAHTLRVYLEILTPRVDRLSDTSTNYAVPHLPLSGSEAWGWDRRSVLIDLICLGLFSLNKLYIHCLVCLFALNKWFNLWWLSKSHSSSLLCCLRAQSWGSLPYWLDCTANGSLCHLQVRGGTGCLQGNRLYRGFVIQ